MKLKNAINEIEEPNARTVSNRYDERDDFKNAVLDTDGNLNSQLNILKRQGKTGNTAAKAKAATMLRSVIKSYETYLKFIDKNFDWD